VRSDVAQYISFRMRAAGYKGPDVFSPAALKLISAASLGLTRRINILCDKALLAAFAGNTHQITAAHAKAAIRDAEFRGAPMPGPGLWLGAAAAALLLAGGGLAWLHLGERSPVAAPPVPSVPPATVSPTQEAPPNAAAAAEPTAAPATDQPPSARQPANPPVADNTNPASPPKTEEKEAIRTATPADIHSPAADPARKSAVLGPLTRQRVEETKTWLDSVSGNRWFIQLLNTDADSAAQVERFLANLPKSVDAGQIRAYTAQSKGTGRLGVIYGEYASREAASRAVKELPPSLKAYGPYPRQVRHLKD